MAAWPVAMFPCRMRRCGPRLPPSHGMREPPLTWATVAGRGGRRQRQRTAAGVRPRRPGFYPSKLRRAAPQRSSLAIIDNVRCAARASLQG